MKELILDVKLGDEAKYELVYWSCLVYIDQFDLVSGQIFMWLKKIDW